MSDSYAALIKANEPLAPPITASVGINHGCQSHCVYCDIWRQPLEQVLAEDLALLLRQLRALGVYLVSFTGGEPFLHPDLASSVAYATSLGLKVNVITNGFGRWRGQVERVINAGLHSVCVSLDSVDPEVYRSLRGVPLGPVLETLDHLLELRQTTPRLAVSANCVVSRHNIDHLLELVAFCEARDVAVGFQPLHPVFARGTEVDELVFGDEDLPRLQRAIADLKNTRRAGARLSVSDAYLDGFPGFLVGRQCPPGFVCQADTTTITIDHRLNVRSCWSMKAIGSLRVDTLEALWGSSRFAKRRRAMEEALDCPKCWLRCHTEERSVAYIDQVLRPSAAA